MTSTGYVLLHTSRSLDWQAQGHLYAQHELPVDGSLGSVVSTISNIAGSSQLLWNQLYGPYGEKRYSAGTVDTAKGFTGQYGDDLTGLDYYVARYYDPVIGRFLSADTRKDNFQGFDPYAYVLGNPETKNDPTGHWWQAVAGALLVVAAVAVIALTITAAPIVAIIAAGVLGGALVRALAQNWSDRNNSTLTDEQRWDRDGAAALWGGFWGGIAAAATIGFAGVIGGAAAWTAATSTSAPVLVGGVLGSIVGGGSNLWNQNPLLPSHSSQCGSQFSCSPKPAGCPADPSQNCVPKSATPGHPSISQSQQQRGAQVSGNTNIRFWWWKVLYSRIWRYTMGDCVSVLWVRFSVAKPVPEK